jgi:hypothetical protein
MTRYPKKKKPMFSPTFQVFLLIMAVVIGVNLILWLATR